MKSFLTISYTHTHKIKLVFYYYVGFFEVKAAEELELDEDHFGIPISDMFREVNEINYSYVKFFGEKHLFPRYLSISLVHRDYFVEEDDDDAHYLGKWNVCDLKTGVFESMNAPDFQPSVISKLSDSSYLFIDNVYWTDGVCHLHRSSILDTSKQDLHNSGIKSVKFYCETWETGCFCEVHEYGDVNSIKYTLRSTTGEYVTFPYAELPENALRAATVSYIDFYDDEFTVLVKVPSMFEIDRFTFSVYKIGVSESHLRFIRKIQLVVPSYFPVKTLSTFMAISVFDENTIMIQMSQKNHRFGFFVHRYTFDVRRGYFVIEKDYKETEYGMSSSYFGNTAKNKFLPSVFHSGGDIVPPLIANLYLILSEYPNLTDDASDYFLMMPQEWFKYFSFSI